MSPFSTVFSYASLSVQPLCAEAFFISKNHRGSLYSIFSGLLFRPVQPSPLAHTFMSFDSSLSSPLMVRSIFRYPWSPPQSSTTFSPSAATHTTFLKKGWDLRRSNSSSHVKFGVSLRSGTGISQNSVFTLLCFLCSYKFVSSTILSCNKIRKYSVLFLASQKQLSGAFSPCDY